MAHSEAHAAAITPQEAQLNTAAGVAAILSVLFEAGHTTPDQFDRLQANAKIELEQQWQSRQDALRSAEMKEAVALLTDFLGE